MRWLASLAFVLALACMIDWSLSQRHDAAAPLHSTASSNSDVSAPTGGIAPLAVRTERSRKVYPYSVIPGGIQSIADLKKAIAKDPIVSAQYAAFHLANARIIRLDRKRTMHVTYRLGNKVYWTKRELILAEGETLITDGSHTALTRCGNLIAEAIETPSSPSEPTPEELSTPIPSPYTPGELESDDRFPDLQIVADPYVAPGETNLDSGGGTGPGTFLPSGPLGPIPYPGGPTPPPVVTVPEPGTAILLLAGLLALLLVQKRKTRDVPKKLS